MSYQYNPHLHIKIWLSIKPNLFMNLENQMRLIEMREKNPNDAIHLIYDSTLLYEHSINELNKFCEENNIIPVDAKEFKDQLHTENERRLYAFYQDELNNIGTGGNPAVASDILRWLPPAFKLGTYTDFDFPVDTSALLPTIPVAAPLLLNIGSFRMSKKEFILTNNDFVAVVDPVAAQQKIEQIQNGVLNRLAKYDNDFVEKTEKELNRNSFINQYLLRFMKNRSEAIYISKSKLINAKVKQKSSLKIRSYIQEVMSDTNRFLDFNKINPEESHTDVIARLRNNLQQQLGLVKYFFFYKEYAEIKYLLSQDTNQFLTCLMKKELNLYLKSIVICTTGPVEISNALFKGYVFSSEEFTQKVLPLSFKHYNLQKSFQTQNALPLHQGFLGMLCFLGVQDGELNDSSWLESGRKLQDHRTEQLKKRQKTLTLNLPVSLAELKEEIQAHIKKISKQSFANLFKIRKEAQIKTLNAILKCFNQENNEFDITQFKSVSRNIYLHKKSTVIHGLLYYKTQKLINVLDKLCHESVMFSLAKNKKINLNIQPSDKELPASSRQNNN